MISVCTQLHPQQSMSGWSNWLLSVQCMSAFYPQLQRIALQKNYLWARCRASYANSGIVRYAAVSREWNLRSYMHTMIYFCRSWVSYGVQTKFALWLNLAQHMAPTWLAQEEDAMRSEAQWHSSSTDALTLPWWDELGTVGCWHSIRLQFTNWWKLHSGIGYCKWWQIQ